MDKAGWINSTSFWLIAEKEAIDTLRNTAQQNDLDAIQQKFLKSLKDLGNSGDIDSILAVELHILQNERTHYSNSTTMGKSLDAAIQEILQCQYMLNIVRNPERYALTNKDNALPKSRKGLLPNDDARKAFRSHATRLTNLDRSRLTELEKKLLTIRHRNLGIAEKLYIALQHHALGLAPAQKDKSSGMEL